MACLLVRLELVKMYHTVFGQVVAYFPQRSGSIESCFYSSFTRCIDGTGQLNFGFATDAIANSDHFLPLSLGPQYNGIV